MRFEKDSTDPFDIDEMIKDVTGGNKKHGLQDNDLKRSKRARLAEDLDDESKGPLPNK